MRYTEAQAKAFVEYITPMISAEAKKRGYKVISAIIAQAIIEGACGTSELAKTYHNHFGMKCGSKWKGKAVNLNTKEEYKPGTLTPITACFRAYDSDEEGVKGYFDFISSSRYSNLKTAQNYRQYAEYLKADGYATSSTYVNTICQTVEKYGLSKYDVPAVIMIGQASKGETGIKGQIAGNQTGTELNVKPYYLHKQGWRVFRAADDTSQNRIAYAMLRAVKNRCIGYDQANRNTLLEASQKYSYDPGEVKVDVECDCSSLVRVCCYYAGYRLPDFNTASEPQVLLKAGFKEVQIDQKTGNGLMIGDILVTSNKGHTCVCVQA